MKSVKPATTYQQQVKILQSRNVEVTDIKACEQFLKNVNYYRLSAYLLSFRRKGTEKYNDVSFKQIVQIYLFDQQLRKLLYEIIDDIENRIRTQLAYYSGHKYGPLGYKEKENYNANHNHDKFMKNIEACIKENKKSPIVQHHQKEYNGEFPIWTIVDFFSIGNLSYFYRGMKTSDREEIAANLFETGFKEMDSWMRYLTDLRNRCAHFARLYYWIFPALPKIPKGDKFKSERRLFSQIYMLKLMYGDKKKWNDEFLKNLEKIIEQYKGDILLKNIGFPQNWREILKK